MRLSKGMINNLSKEFSNKSKKEQNDIFSQLVTAAVINIDNTSVKVNGKTVCVTVCVSDETVGFYVSNRKGHESVKGTPIELTTTLTYMITI